MVVRFRPDRNGGMTQDENGYYVPFDQYKPLEKQLIEALSVLETARDLLARMASGELTAVEVKTALQVSARMASQELGDLLADKPSGADKPEWNSW